MSPVDIGAVIRRAAPRASVLAVGALAFTVAGMVLDETGPGMGWTAIAILAAVAVFWLLQPLTDVTPGGTA